MSAPATGNQLSEVVQIGIIAMHQLGMIPQAIADIAGVARTTVVAVINNADLVAKYTNNELAAKLKKSLPDRIFAKCNAMLANIDPDAKDLSTAQRVTAFAILMDKYLLSTGRATQIIDYHDTMSSITDIDAKIIELEAKIQIKPPKAHPIPTGRPKKIKA